MMKKITVLFTSVLLALGLIASATGCQPEPTPDVQTSVPVEEGILIEMYTRTTMAGVGRSLTICIAGYQSPLLHLTNRFGRLIVLSRRAFYPSRRE